MPYYEFKTEPYDHQVEGIKFAMRQFRKGLGVAFLFEPRTGKTKTTIDTLSILYHKFNCRRVLVIAPNRVLGTWVDEFFTHCPLNVQTIIWDKDARKETLPKSIGPYDLQVVITNFEAFSTPGRRTKSGRRSKANGRSKHKSLLQKWIGADKHAACVVDEGHKLKNPSSKWANMIVGMRGMFAYRFLLTGTPITKAKRASDVYMQWQWVNPKRFKVWGPTHQAFRDHVGVWTHKNGYPQWTGPNEEGLSDLQEGLHKDGLVVRREDCFDLPPREERIIRVPLKRSTTKHYDEMAREMVTQLKNGKIAEASIPLVVTLRLSQITGGYVGIPEPRGDKMVTIAHRVGTEKIDALEELLREEFIEEEQKVVIAARFNPDLNGIERLCARLGIPTYSIRGGMKRSDSDDAIRGFKRAPFAACIIQPQAASLGIDLSTASHMIWYSLTSSWVDYTQACDRIALSENSTTFHYLLAEGTVDELAFEALQTDGDVSRMILTRPELILRR